MIEENKTYLITTDNWFYAPDGNQYRAVFGTAKMFEARNEFGFIPTKGANWFVQVGKDNNFILIAGCQIHYVLRTDERPEKMFGSYEQKDTGKKIPFNDILILE